MLLAPAAALCGAVAGRRSRVPSLTVVLLCPCVSLACLLLQSLHAPEEFQHILRILNTNVDGRKKVMFALTAISGVGRRLSNMLCKKADVDMNKRCVAPAVCSRACAAMASSVWHTTRCGTGA